MMVLLLHLMDVARYLEALLPATLVMYSIARKGCLVPELPQA